MFKFKKRSVFRQRRDSSPSRKNVADAKVLEVQPNYDVPQDGGYGTNSEMKHLEETLEIKRTYSGSLLRGRKKSYKEQQEKARTRALKMSIDFESNATDEYLSLNTGGYRERAENKVSPQDILKKFQSMRSPSGRFVQPELPLQRVSRSACRERPSNTESVFSNPFEDDTDTDDDASVGTYATTTTHVTSKSLSSYYTAPNTVPHHTNISHKKSGLGDLFQSKDIARVNPFEDDSVMYQSDDGSVCSYVSSRSQASAVTLPSYHANTRPKLYQVSDALTPYTDHKKSVDPDPSSPSTPGSGRLRSRFFSRKSKGTNLKPPALM